MFMMVHGWLTLSITGSALWVGSVAGTGGLGFMGFSIVGGVLADRYSRRDLILVTNLVFAASTAVMAALILSENVSVWQLATVAVVVGSASGIRMPAFMSMIVDVVGRERLLAANAANYVGMGIGGIIAPLVAGAIASRWDMGWAYAGISAGGLIGAVVLLGLPRRTGSAGAGSEPIGPAGRERTWDALKAAASYARKTPTVRTLILLALVAESFGWSHNSMLPVIAREVLNTGVTGMGYLQSASMAGFVLSTAVISNVKDIEQKGWLVVGGAMLFSVFLTVFAGARVLPLALVALAAAYAMGAAFDSTLSTVLQGIVPDGMRGRIVSFQAFTWGVNGLAGFHTGALASRFGAPWAIVIGAVVLLLYTIRIVPMAPSIASAAQWRRA